ncbi:hypothetical protein [Longimicrobium sp.]|uniref:hypothetical protein n=1 Tax=Longimicrobium sp. TaxID=2029185 RepID=UPI002C88C743|nr:hypothetical protein [Longimicrobium sp.]HSU13261.1 hypothetical protein [Longimicrobium sp.]
MRKIRLDVENLQVESFATDHASGKAGTVHGREYTVGRECPTMEPGAWGCQNSGVASCVWCPRETETCQDCSWTDGDGAECYW